MKKDLLIVYSTTEGQTRKIAAFLRDVAEELDIDVSLYEASHVPLSPFTYDRVIITGSIHMNAYQSQLTHYIKEHARGLNKVPSMFISVSLTAADEDPEAWNELEKVTYDWLSESGWKPTRIYFAAGALRYTRYNYFKRYIMRQIARKTDKPINVDQDYEFTDWESLKDQFKQFIQPVSGQPAKPTSATEGEESV
jgi:menaquinone-dependent protoporphyrinogen oxidase